MRGVVIGFKRSELIAVHVPGCGISHHAEGTDVVWINVKDVQVLAVSQDDVDAAVDSIRDTLAKTSHGESLDTVGSAR